MKHALFQAFGLELEYMLVHPVTLKVRPVSDQLLFKLTGDYLTDGEVGEVGVSNELTRHVIEIKNDPPVPDLKTLPQRFHRALQDLTIELDGLDASLLPTGMHPLMDPSQEVELWPHEYTEVYAKYHELFGCFTHGFGNIQSVHLNLPFANEEEFVRLHHAIRILLPILPALAASSPLCEGRFTGFQDTRLEYYARNQSRISVITGAVIPEAVDSIADYHAKILDPIQVALAPLDPEGTFEAEWVNSRGAIARFARDSIEIRIMDMQECPLMDVTLCAVVVGVLQELVGEGWSSLRQQAEFPQQELLNIYQEVLNRGDQGILANGKYLELLGQKSNGPQKVWDLWRGLLDRISLDPYWERPLKILMQQGNLAARIHRSLPESPEATTILKIYQELRKCLLDNRSYEAPPNEKA